VNRITPKEFDMRRNMLFLPFVAIVLAGGASCDSSSGESSTSITCENLRFVASSFGDFTGKWRARQVCISTPDPTQHGVCATSTLGVTMTPNDYSLELRPDNTYSQTGRIDTDFDESIPRSCPTPTCAAMDQDYRAEGGSCTETVDACNCNLRTTTWLSTSGTWKLESDMLHMRSADSSTWDRGQEFFVDGSHFVTKEVSDHGAIFIIYSR